MSPAKRHLESDTLPDDAVFVHAKWPSSNAPKVGNEFQHAGRVYRILSIAADEGISWRWRSVMLTLGPWRG